MMLTWLLGLGVACLAVVTIYITVSLLDESVAKEEIGKAARERGIRGSIQGVIDSVKNNHVVFNLKNGGTHFANLDVTCSRVDGIREGEEISTEV